MFPNSPYAHPVGSFRVPVDPPTTEPDGSPLVTVRINSSWLPYIRGALQQLLLQSTWNADETALELVQERVYRLFRAFDIELGDMCDCLEFTNNVWTRSVPNGSGGFTSVPIDPRVDGTVTPPWVTPPVGQTGNCLSGANNAKTFQSAMELLSNTFGVAGTVIALVETITAVFSLAIPVFGEVFDIIFNLAVGAFGAGVVLFDSTFLGSDAQTVYDKISCIISCNSAADGTITASNIANIKTDFEVYMPGPLTAPQALLMTNMFEGWLDGQGPHGMTLLGNKSGIVSADCSVCTGCPWESYFDFTTYDYPAIWVHPQANWQAGKGFVSRYVSGLSASQPYAPISATEIIRVAWDGHGDFTGTTGQVTGTYLNAYYGPQITPTTVVDLNFDHTEVRSGTTQVQCSILADNSPGEKYVSHCLVRGNGTKPAGWP